QEVPRRAPDDREDAVPDRLAARALQGLEGLAHRRQAAEGPERPRRRRALGARLRDHRQRPAEDVLSRKLQPEDDRPRRAAARVAVLLTGRRLAIAGVALAALVALV